MVSVLASHVNDPGSISVPGQYQCRREGRGGGSVLKSSVRPEALYRSGGSLVLLYCKHAVLCSLKLPVCIRVYKRTIAPSLPKEEKV